MIPLQSDDTTGNCPIKKYILIDKTIMTLANTIYSEIKD